MGSDLTLNPNPQLFFACRGGVHIVKDLSASLLLDVLPHPDEGFTLASLHICGALYKGLVAPSANIDGQVKVLNHRKDFRDVFVVDHRLDLILLTS